MVFLLPVSQITCQQLSKVVHLWLRCFTILPSSNQIFYQIFNLNSPIKRVSLKTVVDVQTLKAIVKCDSMYMGQTFKAAFLLSFFSFFRIFNLAPHSMNTFNPLKQLARADIFFASPEAHILTKRSKTLQSRNHILKIPHLKKSTLCPGTVLKNLLLIRSTPTGKPLFKIKYRQKWVP